MLVVNDTHINSTAALYPPTFTLDSGNPYDANPIQRWYWYNWLDLMERIDKISGKKIGVLNGDICDADIKSRTFNVVSRNPVDIERMTVEVIEPFVSRMDTTYMVMGTEAHVGTSGNIEEAIAKDLETVPVSENKYLHDILWLNVEGVRIQIAHHCTAGGVPWNRQSPAANIAAKTIFEFADRKETAPDLIIRAHMHKWYDSYDVYSTRAIIVPCWQGLTHHVNKVLPGSLADCGALIVRIDSGMYEVEKINYKRERQRWITI
jgi:hypothetical protein